jgi:AcrR family transcriptional regulator
METAETQKRQRNPRGQGGQLRDDIIEAASKLLADPAAPPLTLRAVAREVGVAATSVYLHFADIQSLVLAVSERRFSELVKLQDEFVVTDGPPRDRIVAGCRAYCEFGIENPGHYQVMFSQPLRALEYVPVEQMPGYAVFTELIESVAEYMERLPSDPAAFETATMIWQWLHGTVSLRISRQRFPWPALDLQVADAVDRILAGAKGLSLVRCPVAPGSFPGDAHHRTF